MTRRLLFSYLSLTIVVLAMLEVPLGFVNAHNERDDLIGKVERDAVAVASLAEEVLEGDRGSTTASGLERIAARYAADTGGRIVVTDLQGLAIVDSAPPEPGARRFSTRPEFRAALRGDVATGVRRSETLGYSVLYVAVPVASGGVVHGAVRITYPTSRLDERIRNYWLVLAGIAAVALGIAAVVGLRFARWIRRPLEGLEDAAARAAAGDLAARAPVPEGPPEVRALALGFNDMVARVDGLVAAQQDFVADASHQLRTPLTALRLRVDNLERHVDPTGRAGVVAAAAEIDRLSGLVDSLLALARADEDVAPADVIDLVALARTRIAAWQPLLERGVSVELEAVEPVRARANTARVTQVLDNLLANAARAAPDGTVVTVTVRRDGTDAEAIIRDRGTGMTPEEIARAFDRFWRSSSGSGGSGLGLAIARRLIEADGGTIRLRTTAGAGLEAVVRLPTG